MKVNQHGIKLVEDNQSFYVSIYILNSVELEILKTYIDIHHKTGFIQAFKSLVSAFIWFNKKSDKIFCTYVNYSSLKNLIIQN